MLTRQSVRRTALILFVSLALCYLALAPGTTDGRGYVSEDMQAGLSLLASFNAWVKGRPVPEVMWTRHGPITLLFDLPFIKLGKLFVTTDFMLSLAPVVFTAALLTVVFLWLSRLCTPAWSLVLTLIAAFGTMLWPYAYIGLETKQSFFVLLAAYLGLANGKIRTWPRLVLFSVMCGLALTMKSTGAVLLIPIAYLVYVQFRSDWRSRWQQALTVILISSGIFAMGIAGWNLFWSSKGGGSRALRSWTTDSLLQVFPNVMSLFGSPSKGLFIFAPVLLVVIYAIPRAFRTHRDTVIFGLMVTACTTALLSILVVTADELWGPRFMHITVAPLLIIIGAAYPRFEWRKHVPLLALGMLGVMVSFLGAFYYYGARSWAASAAGQNTLEWFAGDVVWNEVIFDARLFNVWWKGGSDPAPWTPAHYWAWTPPPNAPPWKTVNLREYADPQSFLLYYWRVSIKGSDLVIFRICWLSLIAGPLLLAWVVARTIKMSLPAAAGIARSTSEPFGNSVSDV